MITTSVGEVVSADIAQTRVTYSSPLREFWLNFSANRGALIAFAFVVIVILVALLAPWVAPHDPIEQFRNYAMQPPVWEDGGNSTFLLGTDEVGRDILSRLMYGARMSLFIGFCAVILALIPGVILGLLSAFYPRLIGASVMRLMDIMLSMPTLLLAVAIMAVLGPGLLNAMIAIAISSLPAYVRLTRATVMAEINRDYVLAARMGGAGLLRLMFLTVLPNCMAPLIVHITLSFSSAILDIAALGFLGLGVQPPTPEWGTMLASARDYIERAWWVVTMPGVAILLSVISINLIGDGLRDALDPRLKQIG
ncbi:ABC transporter permease subunit [Scandinavium sp. H11S7]|uniref:ABC transporter permease subunit n=1 Tax=Scandinavium hiltneri TaxID=2926519 RepID=A0ABT2E2P2_9ENTR|nr:ABC transporter permease subunit [Scandinavium hiltneri]MCS2162142.1 ABC transporter permease subunit [Scandinavium hiltneri]